MELTYFTDEVNSVKWRSGTARLYSVTSQHFHPLLAQIYTMYERTLYIGNFSLVFTGKVMLSIKIAGRRKPEFLCSVWNKVPLKGFSRIQQSMNIRPILNLIKRKRIIMQDAISRSREIVYGDDFTLMCMLDSIETHHFRHLVLAYACSFAVSCLK